MNPDSGDDERQVRVRIDCPDGDGHAGDDDDAEIMVYRVYLTLTLEPDEPEYVESDGTPNGQTGTDAQYTMSCFGKNYWKMLPGDGAYETGSDDYYIGEGVLKYAFEVPHDLYDYRVIRKLKFKISYYDVDYGDSDNGTENLEPEFGVRRYNESAYNVWKHLSKNEPSYEATTINNLSHR